MSFQLYIVYIYIYIYMKVVDNMHMDMLLIGLPCYSQALLFSIENRMKSCRGVVPQ